MITLNKLILKFLLIPATISVLSGKASGSSVCSKFKTTPKITTTINYGTPTYTLVPKNKITTIAGLKNPLRTMGLTIADFQIQFSLGIDKHEVENGLCININTINFDIGYNSLDVIIDEKYNTNSCQYKTIKRHEQEHIRIYQNELKYYGKLITDEMKILMENLEPFYLSNGASENKINKKIDHILNSDEKLNILKSRLKQALIEKNIAHDSQSEYIRIKNSCTSW